MYTLCVCSYKLYNMFFFRFYYCCRHVRLFYQAIVDKMIEKFPFGNKVLTNLLWLHPDPEKRKGVQVNSGRYHVVVGE